MKDGRDTNAPEWNLRRYKQNRLALRGWAKVIEVVDRYMQRGRYFTKELRVDADTYRLVDELARLEALDLVGVGIALENAEVAERRQRRGPARKP